MKHDLYYLNIFIPLCVCVCVCVHVHMCAGVQGGQKRMLGPQELKLDSCELPDVGAGGPTLVLCKRANAVNA